MAVTMVATITVIIMVMIISIAVGITALKQRRLKSMSMLKSMRTILLWSP